MMDRSYLAKKTERPSICRSLLLTIVQCCPDYSRVDQSNLVSFESKQTMATLILENVGFSTSRVLLVEEAVVVER